MRVTKVNVETMYRQLEQEEFRKEVETIEKITDLETLKYKWRIAQKKEAYQEVLKSFGFLNSQDQDSFSNDGYLGSEAEFRKGPRVLFALRECNSYGNKEENYFWFKDDIVKQNKGDGILVRRLLKIYSHILKGQNIETEKLVTVQDLRTAAYMNLNKRGGKNRTNHRYLKYYVWMYQDFIRKEIELINPDIIICGGTYGLLKTIVDQKTEAKMIELKHPSYHFISDQKYIEEFDEKYKKRGFK